MASTEAGEAGKVNTTTSEDVPSPSAKVVLITGGNSGIGFKAAELFLKAGNYDVILACRSEERGTDAVTRLKSLVPETEATFMKLDLASLKSIHEFADAFHATGKPLNILVNNAGLTQGFRDTERKFTEDGYELTFGVNHLGHYLLTNLLISDLKKIADSEGEARVVVVSSELHDPDDIPSMKEKTVAPFEFDNLQFEKPGTYTGLRAYSRSKLANVLFTYELARRLEGSNVTATAMTPGFIPETGLSRNSGAFMNFMLNYILKPVFRWRNISRTLDHGAGMVFDLATKEEYKGVTGKYFKDNKEKESSKLSYDQEIAKKLWEVSADMVKYEEAKAL